MLFIPAFLLIQRSKGLLDEGAGCSQDFAANLLQLGSDLVHGLSHLAWTSLCEGTGDAAMGQMYRALREAWFRFMLDVMKYTTAVTSAATGEALSLAFKAAAASLATVTSDTLTLPSPVELEMLAEPFAFDSLPNFQGQLRDILLGSFLPGGRNHPEIPHPLGAFTLCGLARLMAAAKCAHVSAKHDSKIVQGPVVLAATANIVRIVGTEDFHNLFKHALLVQGLGPAGDVAMNIGCGNNKLARLAALLRRLWGDEPAKEANNAQTLSDGIAQVAERMARSRATVLTAQA
jgi:hypothetical protein